MKLLYCKKCRSIFSLCGQRRNCPGCHGCGGYYIDGLNAVWWGEAIPLGFRNSSFISALASQPDEQPGLLFEAFVIEKNCRTFKQQEKRNEDVN